jgi:hypothetical protein
LAVASVQRAVGHFGQKKNSHQSTPASSLSFVDQLVHRADLDPGLAAGGSTVLTTSAAA